MKKITEVGLGIIFSIVAASANAATVTLNFEELNGMNYFSGAAVPDYAKLTNQYGPYGVSFSSGAGYVAVVNLGVGHATSGRNGIGGSTQYGMLTYDHAFPIVATFDGVTNFVSLRGDFGGSGYSVTLNAYDANGTLVASDTEIDIGGETLSVAGSGIHSVEFLGTYDWGGVAVDDFSFNTVSATQSVPEPQSALLVGFALAGLAMSRRREQG